MDSALYVGTLRHRRFRPYVHDFQYRLFMPLLDLDEIPELMRRSRWSSHNRFNWAAFYDRDHFGDPQLSLRERVEQSAIANSVELAPGKIFLLTHLRYLGYVFNPISMFYCCDGSGQVACVLAEVNNTFGQSRNYWLTRQNRMQDGGILRYRSKKTLHVSPFMPMDLDYTFVIEPPGDRLFFHMTTQDGESHSGAPLFDATLKLERREWTASALRALLSQHPWITAKVIAGIHWQALRLYLKGNPVYTHPEKIR